LVLVFCKAVDMVAVIVAKHWWSLLFYCADKSSDYIDKVNQLK
jgi:hypothetical protein